MYIFFNKFLKYKFIFVYIIQRTVLEAHPLLTAGAVLDLRAVPVFAPDVRHRYLNIMPENIVAVYLCGSMPTRRRVLNPDPLLAYAPDVRRAVEAITAARSRSQTSTFYYVFAMFIIYANTHTHPHARVSLYCLV